MSSPQFSDPTRLRQRQRRTSSRGVPRRRGHTHSSALRRSTVFILRRIRPTILNFRIFLDKKGAEIRQSLMAGEEKIWELRQGPTQEFTEHWQEDEVFQELLTGYYNAVSGGLRVEDGEIQSDNTTTFNQCFDALRYYFDEHSHTFEYLSLDIVTSFVDAEVEIPPAVEIPPPDVEIWQQEWERMTIKYSLFPGDQDYDYETIVARRTRGGWVWN